MEDSAAPGVLLGEPLRNEPERLDSLCRSLRPPEYPADVFDIARRCGLKASPGEVPQGARGQVRVEGKKRKRPVLVVPRIATKSERHFTAAYLLGVHFLDAAPHGIRPVEAEKEDAAAWRFAAELMMPEKLVEDALLRRVESIGQAAAALNVPPIELERRIQQMYASEVVPWRKVRKHPEGVDAALAKILERNAAPVPVHFLAALMGVRVRVMPQQELSGVLTFTGKHNGSKAEVSLSAKDPRPRQRFTLAMLLQVLLREMPGRYIRHTHAVIEPALARDYGALASQLLVPSHLLEPLVMQEYATDGRRVRLEAVKELAQRFIVSDQAMEVTLKRDNFHPETPLRKAVFQPGGPPPPQRWPSGRIIPQYDDADISF